MKKIKLLPKVIRYFFLVMSSGLGLASILAIFKIDLGTIWRNVIFALVALIVWILFYKPFKNCEQ